MDITDLLRADAHPHPVGHLDVRETNTSWIVLTGALAYKVKKALKLAFIDTSSLERRHYLCCEELRLNQRLAPDLYEAVVPISLVDGRARLGSTQNIVEYAVCMRQFAAADELLSLLKNNDVSLDDINALARVIADFHAHADVATATHGDAHAETLVDFVFDNTSQLRQLVADIDASMSVDGLIDWTHDSARTLESSFRMREQQGFIRECHGDLHAGNIVRLNRRLVPFDCLEFDPKLRFIDPINDLAFLVMDLMSQQRTDLAFALLSRYLEVSGDYEALQLLPFYAVYRALVRAKVDALSAMQLHERRSEFLGRMLRRLHAASTWIDRTTPTLILMHGPSGSGKSWLSERLVPALNAVRVRSDVERKRLAGVADTQLATAKLPQGCHSAEFNARTYSHVTDCASHCLRAGFTTIVDAASLDAADREVFRALAARLSVRYLIVSCVAPPTVLAQRVACRTLANDDASDADSAILKRQLHDFQSIAGDETRHAVCIDTQRHDAIDRVRAAYDRLQSVV